MKTLIKSLYQKTNLGFYFIQPFTKVYHFWLYKKFLKRETFVKHQFKKSFGSSLNIEDPKTLNEKINWLKLYYKHPLATQLADKFAVREFIINKIGEEYLVPLLYKTKNYRDIIPSNLPDIPFIIKTNHDSSGGIIIHNKNENHNWKQIQNTLRSRMSQNFYWDGRERQYKEIEPILIVEKLLTDIKGTLPADYKVHCFNGKVRMINVDMGRNTKNHYRNWYNRQWIREPYSWSSVLGDGKHTDPSDLDIEKPELLDRMCELSEKLVKGFPYLRADWYIYNNQLFFGELTFHHNGGMRPIQPEIWDEKLGKELSLPNNYLTQ